MLLRGVVEPGHLLRTVAAPHYRQRIGGFLMTTDPRVSAAFITSK
jgi:hypothetical protein